MKIRRSERLIDMTQYLLDHPHTLVSLTYFADRYQSAKSSISEDLAIVKKTFKERGTGILETIPGAAGGVRFIPEIPYEEAEQLIMDLCDRLSEQDRLLPGGYVYLSDLLCIRVFRTYRKNGTFKTQLKTRIKSFSRG